MHRHAPKIAALCAASLIAGLMLAETTPNDVRPARNSAIEALGQPQIVRYPGEGRVIFGPDSSPVEYSPQYRAVLEAQERERVARLAIPPVSGAAYDYVGAYAQPKPLRERAAPVEQLGFEPDSGAAAVTVHRAATSQEAAADEAPAEAVEAFSADRTEG